MKKCCLIDCKKEAISFTDPNEGLDTFCQHHKDLLKKHPRHNSSGRNILWCQSKCGASAETLYIVFCEPKEAFTHYKCSACGGDNKSGSNGITLEEKHLFTIFKHCLNEKGIAYYTKKNRSTKEKAFEEIKSATTRSITSTTLKKIKKQLKKIPALENISDDNLDIFVHLFITGLLTSSELKFDNKKLELLSKEIRTQTMEKIFSSGINGIYDLLNPSLQEAHKEYTQTIQNETKSTKLSVDIQEPIYTEV